jgi:hypothetical protein
MRPGQPLAAVYGLLRMGMPAAASSTVDDNALFNSNSVRVRQAQNWLTRSVQFTEAVQRKSRFSSPA